MILKRKIDTCEVFNYPKNLVSIDKITVVVFFLKKKGFKSRDLNPIINLIFYLKAMTSISTLTSLGNLATSTQALAGFTLPRYSL